MNKTKDWVKEFEKEFKNHGFIPEEKERFLSFIAKTLKAQQRQESTRRKKEKIKVAEENYKAGKESVIKIVKGIKVDKNLDGKMKLGFFKCQTKILEKFKNL